MRRLFNPLILLSEQSLIDTVSRIVPWLAPMAPASFAFQSLKTMGLNPLELYVIVAAIEGTGVTLFYTWQQFKDYNETRNKTDQEASTIGVKWAIAFYITVVLLVNVVLDLHRDPAQIAVRAFLSLLSIPSAYLLAVRTQHARRVTAIQHDKDEMKFARLNAALQKELAEKQSQIASLKNEMANVEQRVKATVAEQIAELKVRIAQLTQDAKPVPVIPVSEVVYSSNGNGNGKTKNGTGKKVTGNKPTFAQSLNDDERNLLLTLSIAEAVKKFGVSAKTVGNARKELRK